MARSGPRSGVRRQATVAAALVVAVALVLGATALVLVLQRSLSQALEDNVTEVVNEDANILASEGVAGLARSERDEGPDNVLVQVIAHDSAGATVAYTSKPSRTQPISSLRPAAGEMAMSGVSVIPVP